MYLRQLDLKDAPLMFEWMQDPDVINGLHGNYLSSILSDAEEFIRMSADDKNEIHFAITTDSDEYVGTTSIRHIDKEIGLAEFALVVIKSAMGKGYAWYGMTETLKYAFEELGLERIYWRVSCTNERAVRFFKKHGFNIMDEDIPREIIERHSNENNFIWFAVWKGDDYLNDALSRGIIADCKVIRIKTVPTIEAGELSFFEGNHDIEFDIKRIYYISKVPEGVRRGFHAHKELKQLLFCPYGKIQLILENRNIREEITLSDPSIGIVIDKPTWREMLWMQKDSVLVVAASDYYNVEDYIRDYTEFKKYISEEN